MIQFTPSSPRRKWPAVLLMAVVFVVFLFLISACGPSHDERVANLDHRMGRVEFVQGCQ